MVVKLNRGATERARKLLRLVLSDTEWDFYERTKGVRFPAYFYGKTCLAHCSPEWCGIYVVSDGEVVEKRYIYPVGRDFEAKQYCHEDRIVTYMLWEELTPRTLCQTGCGSVPSPDEAKRVLERLPHLLDRDPFPYY